MKVTTKIVKDKLDGRGFIAEVKSDTGLVYSKWCSSKDTAIAWVAANAAELYRRGEV